MSTAYITDTRFAAHTMPGHPEHAGRLDAIQEHLQAEHLADRLSRVEPVPATDADVQAVHASGYLAQLERIAAQEQLVMYGLDTYITPQSYDLARLAAGGVMRVVDAVLEGIATNGAAAIRPPGHHATPSAAMGFCLLNNVAIAARYAQRVHGLDRVLIVDYDVHHGNGTQDVFYTDPSVLYISTHQSPLYPGTGAMRETGAGAGAGYTLNLPLPPGVGDAGYAMAFEQVVLPAAQRFSPQLILVSVGFDVHWADPLANMQLSLAGYDRLARHLIATAATLCDGRIVFVLEGGYHLDVLSHGWSNVIRALMGDDFPGDPLGPSGAPERPVDRLLDELRQLHKLT
jgi:acetoin utilization deacetylase AcuC-like enzyme